MNTDDPLDGANVGETVTITETGEIWVGDFESTLTGDVTTTAARRELREVAQLLDAELDPTVTTGSFVVASDGGEKR